VLRNDHQDALGVGLGVTEFAPSGKSAEEIRGLWQWVWARLNRESHSCGFSERSLMNNRKSFDFDSAIPRFESWRPSQASY